MKTASFGILVVALGAVAPTIARMPAPAAKEFVMKAGASDKFELSEAKLMTGSANADIRSFAKQMITDHTKSTGMVKAAAKADGMVPAPPMLNAKQQGDLQKLTAAKGKARDSLYLAQQKPAHQEALALMQAYSQGGTATHLKGAANQIVPVVQGHIDMLDKMSAM